MDAQRPKAKNCHKPKKFDTEGEKLLRQLAKSVRRYGQDRTRLRTLALFNERTVPGRCTRPKSTVKYNDRPEIELLLKHRDAIDRIEELLPTLRAALESDTDPKSISRNAATLARMEDNLLTHQRQMQNMFDSLSRESIAQESNMTKIAAEAARLVQTHAEHKDKMLILLRGHDPKQNEDKVDVLAKRYGVSRKEVERMIENAEEFVIEPDTKEVAIIDGQETSG